MKTALIIVGILIIAAVGYYVFMMPQAPATDEMSDAGSEQKIDINAVCDSALAYMTFPSGAEAEAWVESCKRGEHPEAIEQWKVQMGITDDRTL